MCVVNVSLQHRWEMVCAYLVHLIKNGVVNVWLQHRSDMWEKAVAHLVSFEHVQPQQHVHRLLFQDGERRLQERVADLYLTCAATTAGWNTRLLQHPANSHHNIYAANIILIIIIISFPSTTQSFIPGLRPSFSANPSHSSLSFSPWALTTWIPQTFIVTSYFYCCFWAYLFLLFSCPVQ